MGRCADRIGYFLGALALLPVLLIVVLVAYFTGRPMLAKLAGAAIVIDLIVLWKNS